MSGQSHWNPATEPDKVERPSLWNPARKPDMFGLTRVFCGRIDF
jgi:hypothetical protein